ncbi:MAG: RNA polymerase factor sigma-32 [Deltaproteobacteria bacterium]|nr:RNA polymerase factor sigma-32 [Deltaproteobacteria bacterium]NND27951.1 RNA polymerase factor sigma-32 [Myxococcales bacterium]MBT8463096.1 RNA polymerase factor sigma-32 [Deltaproteobacteria bacterium]MBT8482838.1 RNA polymerase factor sigma-32 [Deltaproteobacteria bacterium]NNK08071.1 RNA polymerase factor sigma-32 [Myxococcales bacterium]
MTGKDSEESDEMDDLQEAEISEDAPRLDEEGPDALAVPRSALSRRDPLAVYMRDVQRYPLLSKEEEHELAVRFLEEEDLEAAKRLVTSNLRLVVKIAYDYRQAYKNILDLVQEGNIGLMQAVKKYDPYKGVKLSSYAAWWIRAYILRYILNNHRLVKVGTTQAQRKLFFNLQKEKARLSAMGIEPTAEVIAERLNVPKRDVVSMDMRLAAGDASLDAPVGMGEGRTVARVEILPSEQRRADDNLADAEIGDQFSSKIHEFGKSLEGKEKQIFDDRLVAEDPKTLQALGDEFGVSRERVRQIEKRLLEKLKAYLRSKLGDTVVEVYESP